jgi:ATP-binding cassette subfamily B protein
MNRFAGLRLVGPYLRPYRGRVALALLSLLVAAGTVLAFGACLRALIDRGFAQGRPDVLNYALASLLVVALVLAVASGARFYLVSWLGERVVGNLRKDLFDHVLRLGPAWFELRRSGDVMSRISADAQLIEQVVGSSASSALRNTLMCMGGIVMLVVTNPKLALIVLGVVPVVVAPSWWRLSSCSGARCGRCRARRRRASPTRCRRAARRWTPCARYRRSARRCRPATASAGQLSSPSTPPAAASPGARR